MNAQTIVRNGALGIVGGLVASLAMNSFQSGWSAASKLLKPEQDRGGGGEPSTVKAADQVSQATTGKPIPNKERQTAGQATHYAFGALLGGLYGAASTAYPAVRTGFGAPFGAAVWAVADELAVPAAGLAKPPTQTPLSTHAYSLASHLLFGAVLESSQLALQRGFRAFEERRERQAA
ncbi:DUF1440 domain-containing protein [Sphingomonas sp. BN140010]|uniref:DUF1440 domain-containing protein n=1 Tax=Sphingomonas arvum TaxID=2992113 RepID=A0ABT3JFY8_9SPHN|nr:DUF1440 domain-containing protein [Sphingomonas sp. BN140010]MCW3797839.1 DUF1440 domain-containing protein [Sphingomonas sp. BN140010]